MARNKDIEGLDAELQARGRESRWERYRLPVDLEGKSLLDVGCWEGVHCADAVRHGAEDVVGVDLCTSDALIANVDRYGFEFLQMDVFGDSFLGLGQFDVVLCSGVLPAVQSPALLLARLRTVARELVVLETTTTTHGGGLPMMLFQGGGEGTKDKSNWWAPNRACLHEMLEATGFGGISTVWEDDRREGFGRACMHAVPAEPDRRRLMPRKPKQMSIHGGNRTEKPVPVEGRFPEGDPRNDPRVNVGIVSKWFNRGQPVVGRYLRSGVDSLGHRSFVLAKPRREKGPMSGALERTGVWDQPDVTPASSFETPLEEYLAWVEANSIEAILCDQNYQFTELAELRRRGVRVIGRFVWEHFTREHVEPAREAYDVVYSVTEAERERYRGWGMETPRVPWGIHPELLAVEPARVDDGLVRFVFPGGFLGHRKPAEPVIEAFSATTDPQLRLLVKAQVERTRLEKILPMVEADDRIDLVLADEPWAEHLAAVAANDVSISPSRWEGLGLPLYEAIAFGMPTITNDDPPMNEVIEDGVNGVLVASHPDGRARSGIPARRPDIAAMREAIERAAEPATLAALREGTVVSRERFRWERTLEGLAALLER